MKLLILTQVVDMNDSGLGFFHRWIHEFAKTYDEVTVICLKKGYYSLPNNVRVLSLGKEDGFGKWHYVWSFYKYIWQYRRYYNVVFVHMNPEYVCLGALIWKILNKKIFLWYVHKSVNFKLRLAYLLSDKVFTASNFSFRLKWKKKVLVLGHGIETDLFFPHIEQGNLSSERCILSVGRIAEVKSQLELVKIFFLLHQDIPDLKLYIIGEPVTKPDHVYFEKVISFVKNNGLSQCIKFIGNVKHKDLPEFYRSALVCINLSKTGSLDKDVLEAMACGSLVFTTNEAFGEILPPEFVLNELDQEKISKQLKLIIDLTPERKNIFKKNMQDLVLSGHSLNELIKKIKSSML